MSAERRSLEEILNEIKPLPKDRKISYTKLEDDPITKSMAWDVKYDVEPPTIYEFKDSFKELNSFVKNLIILNGRLKPTDPKLEELLHIAKNFRNRYHRYLNSYQPDWDNK